MRNLLLPMALLLATALIVPPAVASGAEIDATAYTTAMLRAVNAERASRGLDGLTTAPLLRPAGQAWAEHLAQDTESLTHRPAATLVRDATGDWDTIGENLSRFAPGGDEKADVGLVMEAFMASPAHRENVLGAYRSLDTAVSTDGDGAVYLVLTFIG
jgi:uncharacterized protein YkwD